MYWIPSNAPAVNIWVMLADTTDIHDDTTFGSDDTRTLFFIEFRSFTWSFEVLLMLQSLPVFSIQNVHAYFMLSSL